MRMKGKLEIMEIKALRDQALNWAIATIFRAEVRTMETVETKALRGRALDWAIATILLRRPDLAEQMLDRLLPYTFRPSSDWKDGGPLIQREGISLSYSPRDLDKAHLEWVAWDRSGAWTSLSDNALEAAMRAIVYSKRGHEVAIPTEIANEIKQPHLDVASG